MAGQRHHTSHDRHEDRHAQAGRQIVRDDQIDREQGERLDTKLERIGGRPNHGNCAERDTKRPKMGSFVTGRCRTRRHEAR